MAVDYNGIVFIQVSGITVKTLLRAIKWLKMGEVRFSVILEYSVPNSCDVVHVTNNGSRNGNVYMSLYQHLVFYLYSANSQNFTLIDHQVKRPLHCLGYAEFGELSELSESHLTTHRFTFRASARDATVK